jgi:succinate dehydrogenase / fumarate reductase cytochrome b subunit
MAERPLSPHLSIWKWGPAMFTSILHRITGAGFALAGLGVLLWWLGALASGKAAYEKFTALAMTPYGYVVLVGISWAFFTHLVSGLRHFVMDAGAGYELDENRAWAIVAPFIGILLTLAFWAAIYFR